MAYYRTQKPSKIEAPHKSLVTINWPHLQKYQDLERETEQIVMIDPGVRNFCIRCEIRHKNGQMKPKIYAKWDIQVADPSGEDVNIVTAELSRRLNKYREILIKSDRILIERQLAINYQSTLIMQHCITYFELLLADQPHLPIICIVDPKLKSRILAGRGTMTKPELKAWSPGEAIKWLQRQNDYWSVKIIEESKKKDDFADVVVMREAYYRYIKSPFATPDEGVKIRRNVFVVKNSENE